VSRTGSRHSKDTLIMRILSLCLGALLLAVGCGTPDLDGEPTGEAVNPSRLEQSLTMPACGTVLATFNGTSAKSNAGYTGTGNSCAGNPGVYGYEYQCVELVMRHFSTKWGLTWYGNAHDLLNNAPRTYVDVYTNGDTAHPPVPGDMIVFDDGGAWGHVALVTAVTSTTVSVIEQNVVGSGSRTLSRSGGSVNSGWTGWWTLGWAHAKANTGGSSGGWSCASSAYAGQQYWTCSGSTRNKCNASGTPVMETCARGCLSRNAGQDDLCIAAASSWSCANSAYAGQQYWTCSGGYLYKCDSVGGIVAYCPAGCNVGALGTNDTCK
jgi:surface antigen